MIAAAVLASLWAQAEPAPPEAPESATVPSATAPATASPATAQPAPAPSLPVTPPAPEPKLASTFAVSGRLAYRVGADARRVGPSFGFAIGGSFERRYLQIGDVLDLGVAVEFSFARFATAVTRSTVPSGGSQPYDDTRALNQTSFAVMQTAMLMLRSVRPYAAAGVGAAISYFSTPEQALAPGSASAVQPVARASVGVEIPLAKTTAVTAVADYTHAFTRPTYQANDGQSYSLFGDALTAGAGLRLRF
jgi:hypothetical protein